MKSAVLMLYGPYEQHPWQEDMFLRPDKIQKSINRHGFSFDVAMVTHAPTGRNEVPEIRVAENPVYDQKTGMLLEAHFKPGNLNDYPSIIDHWVVNFQDEIVQADGTLQRTAHGVGLPAGRLWNHKNIQEYGNRKDLMDAVIASQNVSIPTFDVLDYGSFIERYGANHELIYKPQGGSRGVGVEVFDTIAALHDGIRTDSIATNGFIQPYLRNNQPIHNVTPLTAKDAEIFAQYNADTSRPREIRMHVIATTDVSGDLKIQTYPMIKISEPHRKYLKFEHAVALDPTCIGPGSFIYDKTVALARALCHAAGTNGTPIPQYYGVFDWLVDGDINNPTDVYVVDGNCRGPGIPECAVPAREALEAALVSSGKSLLI